MGSACSLGGNPDTLTSMSLLLSPPGEWPDGGEGTCLPRPGNGLTEGREHACHVSAEQRRALLHPAAVPTRISVSRQVTGSEVPQTGGLFQ